MHLFIAKTANRDSVRDRGVGGSNPLAPTNFLIFTGESAELNLAVPSVFTCTSRVENRVSGASNPSTVKIVRPQHISLPRGCLEDVREVLIDLNIRPVIRDERFSARRLQAVATNTRRPPAT